MTISNGVEVKHIMQYPPTKSVTKFEHEGWLDEMDMNEEIIQPLLPIRQDMGLKENTDEN